MYPKSPSVNKHESCCDAISADPICPFPIDIRSNVSVTAARKPKARRPLARWVCDLDFRVETLLGRPGRLRSSKIGVGSRRASESPELYLVNSERAQFPSRDLRLSGPGP